MNGSTDRREEPTDKMTEASTPLPTLSPSALGAYEICGRRGQYYHDRTIERTTTMPLAVGSSYHAVLEHSYRTGEIELDDLIAIGMLDLQERVEADDFVSHPGDMDMLEAAANLERMIMSWHTTEGTRWHNISDVEYKVEAQLGQHHRMLGFIDLVVNDPLHGIILIDHKTAGKMWGGAKKAGDPRKLVQAALYAESYAMQTGEEPSHFAYDVMTYAGRFHRVWVPIHSMARAPFIDRWREVSDSIFIHESNGIPMPTNPSGFLCSPKWCSYWDMCPMGAELDSRLTQEVSLT